MILTKRFFGVAVVLTLSFWAVKPLLVSGFFPMHDDTQVARVFEIGKALKDGMFPIRWVQDLGYGYGYPIFNFYAPLAYYVGGIFNVLGADALLSTKIMLGFGIVLSGLCMYLLARELWGELGGIVAGLFYLYAPYHALDIYVRGDVGEIWAYAFLPLIFYGLWKVYRDKKWKFVVIGSIGYAGVILSHNLTAMMVTPFILIFTLFLVLCSEKSKRRYMIYHLSSILCLGLMITSFYWIPALFEMKYTNVLSQVGGGADFRDHFVCLSQLWESTWGFGGSVPGCIDGLSFRVGKLHIFAVLLSLFLCGVSVLKRRDRVFLFVFSIAGLLLATFFMLEQSRFIWDTIPIMAFFQYPWRFLLLASFFSSLLAGAALWFLKFNTSLSYIVFGIALFLLLFGNGKLFAPQTIAPKTSLDYTDTRTLQWIASKTSDEYMPKDFKKPQISQDIPSNPFQIKGERGTVKDIRKKTQVLEAKLVLENDDLVRVAIAYFPAWKILVDGREVDYEVKNDGMYVKIAKGEHTVEVRFVQTFVEKLANVASLTGIGFLFLGIIRLRFLRFYAKETS